MLFFGDSQRLLSSLVSSRFRSSPFYTSAKPTVLIETISSGEHFDDGNTFNAGAPENLVNTGTHVLPEERTKGKEKSPKIQWQCQQ